MQSSKVAVVTGSSKGIGFAIVKGLCEKFDGHVYLTARNADRGMEAVAKLREHGLDPKFHKLDVDDIDSIRQFRDFLQKEYGGLDVLVNNAAIAYKINDPAPFHQQAEDTIKTNFFSLRNVCNELFPLLRPHARVVNISSFVGMLFSVPGANIREKFASPTLVEDELAQLMSDFVTAAKEGVHVEQGWSPGAYSMSKVGVTALTFIQQRKVDQDPRPDIAVNCVNPGYVSTDMTSHKGHLTPEQGAEAPIYAALLPNDYDFPRRKMIWNDKTFVDWASDRESLKQ